MRSTVLILCTLLLTSSTTPQWSTDPSNNLIVGYGLLPELCSDSAGGAYVTYEVSSVYPRHIALRRLNRYGYQPWGSSRAIQGIWPDSRRAHIAEDGRYGVLIGFTDIMQTGPFSSLARGRVQRVDSSGGLLWGSAGVRITTSETNHGVDAIVSDSRGGCIVAWRDTLNVLGLQRIDSAGVRLWGDSGRIVASTPYESKLVRTDAEHFVITYARLIKRFTLDGIMTWGNSAIDVGLGLTNIVPDELGGVIISGSAGTAQNILFVTQRIDSAAHKLWQLPYVVLAESTIFLYRGYPFALQQEPWLACFSWNKSISAVPEVFRQILRSDGSSIYPFGRQRISRVTPEKGIAGVLLSDSATILCVWIDYRSPSGTRVWGDSGIVIENSVNNPLMNSDGRWGSQQAISRAVSMWYACKQTLQC